MIHSSAEIEDGAHIGKNTSIWHLCHVRDGARIGSDCSLGRNVYVEGGAMLGNGVRVQNNVSIYNGVFLDDFVFIGPGVVFTNDLRPRAFPIPGGWQVVQTVVGEGASIGAGAVIVCGVSIGKYAMIGAGAVVTRNVKPFELIVGLNERRGLVDHWGRSEPEESQAMGMMACNEEGDPVEARIAEYERQIGGLFTMEIPQVGDLLIAIAREHLAMMKEAHRRRR